MNIENENQAKSHDEHQHENQSQDKETVTITIDDKTWTIHRGSHTIIELKTLAGIPLAYAMNQAIEGQLEPLSDNGRVTVKGGEIFISHPKDGSSS